NRVSPVENESSAYRQSLTVERRKEKFHSALYLPPASTPLTLDPLAFGKDWGNVPLKLYLNKKVRGNSSESVVAGLRLLKQQSGSSPFTRRGSPSRDCVTELAAAAHENKLDVASSSDYSIRKKSRKPRQPLRLRRSSPSSVRLVGARTAERTMARHWICLLAIACSFVVNVRGLGVYETCPLAGQEVSRDVCCEPATGSSVYLLMPYYGWCCVLNEDGKETCYCKPDKISEIQKSQPTCALGATPVAIDGGWSSWFASSSCSVTCGSGGQQTFTRSCTNPAPANGGASCSGSSTETRPCSVATTCPAVVNGGWSSWFASSSCSVTCGSGGQQTFTRSCTNPAPANGGASCSGPSTETRPCSASTLCPVDGGWSSWFASSSCSVTCGSGGQQTFTRSCTNPAPANGGASCSGSSTETRPCSVATTCPAVVNGGWSSWSASSSCSVTCGSGGQQTFTRSCTNPAPANGGASCSGPSTETRPCSASTLCPVDGGWSSWFASSSCSVTCGSGGQQTFTRSCTNPAPANGGAYCSGPSTETRTCSVATTCPAVVNGGWSSWFASSSCSVTCGSGGQQTFTRSCTNPAPANGGAYCSGPSTETRTCSVATTCLAVVNGGWTSWSAITTCSATCGSGGTQFRVRTCSNPAPANGGASCDGLPFEQTPCNQNIQCPVDGGWSDWFPASSCSATCGTGGTQFFYRTCTNPVPAYGGSYCNGAHYEPRPCSADVTCPADRVDGGWSNWFTSACSVTCGSGTQTRTRTCTNPSPANVNGGWSDWMQIGSCSATCGNSGSQLWIRTCDNPTPSNGGVQCVGSATWSQWGPCNTTCGNDGTQMRTRTCTDPAPANGGADCTGPDSETRPCPGIPCPVDGQWGDWSPYGACTASCGSSGFMVRTRVCNNPEPANGGDYCFGSWFEAASCPNISCPVDGGWSAWSELSACNAACGESGTQTRTRTCNNPEPEFGGSGCAGSDTDSVLCSGPVCPIAQCQIPASARLLNSYIISDAAPSITDGVVSIYLDLDFPVCNGAFAWDYGLNEIVLYTTDACKTRIEENTGTMVMEGVPDSEDRPFRASEVTGFEMVNSVVKYRLQGYMQDFVKERFSATGQVPACVFNPITMASLVMDTSNCYITSWGYDQLNPDVAVPFAGTYPNTTKSVPVQLVDDSDCPGLTTGNKCFQSPTSVICTGDEAAPVFCSVGSGQFVLYGLLKGKQSFFCDISVNEVYPIPAGLLA
ncbi:hypothetical protein BaRGS_00002292, partial [Batillaria attramentaria]